MTNPDFGTRPARTHDTRGADGGGEAGARHGTLRRLVPIWCGVVLLAVATTLVRMPGAVLTIAWIAAWVASSAGLVLIGVGDGGVCCSPGPRREPRSPATPARR